MVWDPELYARGNYFQNKVSELFRKNFSVKPTGNILDIGCGDGQYSSVLSQQYKKARILGIDKSVEMIGHANQHWASEHLSFESHPIEHFQSNTRFDFILSFWCLHWTNIHISFPKIYDLLSDGGRLYAVFSSFSTNSIFETWQELSEQNRHQELLDQYLSSNETPNNYFYSVLDILNHLPFKQVKLNLKSIRVALPHIDYFKNLLLTMPFAKRHPAEITAELISDMLICFQDICDRRYGGRLYYETRPIFLEALK